MEAYQVTKERVLKAASRDSASVETLKMLFPKAFKEKFPIKTQGVYQYDNGEVYMIVRVGHDEYALANISGSVRYFGNYRATLDNLASLFSTHNKSFTYLGQAQDVVQWKHN